jgi:putative intracellular protease/amidase/predicted SnoaL-like aldol condensation-catalyzing enzyme
VSGRRALVARLALVAAVVAVGDAPPARAAATPTAATPISVASTAARRALLVVTSTAALPKTGAPTGFVAQEAIEPYVALTAAGVVVDVASIRGGAAPMDPKSDPRNAQGMAKDFALGKTFLADPATKDVFAQTKRLADVVADAVAGRYDAVIFAGGLGASFDFPGDPSVQAIARALWQRGGVVGALCHGSSALGELKLEDGSFLVAGRTVTGFSNAEQARVKVPGDVLTVTVENALVKAGGLYRAGAPFTSHVERDGNLITAQQPQSAAAFAGALITALRETAAERKAKDALHDYHVVVWEQGQLAKAKEFLGPGFTSHATPFVDPRNGEPQKSVLGALRTAFPDLTSHEDALIIEGDLAVLRWTITGTHQGELFGVKPTQKKINVSGLDMIRIVDGKFVEHWGGIADQMDTVMRQIATP